MDIDSELRAINELIQLEENNRSSEPRHLYHPQDDVVESRIQEVLDSIQDKRYCLERMTEKLQEERDEVRKQIEEQHRILNQLTIDNDRENRELNQLKQRLEQIQRELKSSQAREDVIIENIPKLKALKQMYSSITRMTLDEKTRNTKLSGFVINERKDDVNTFTFDMTDTNITPHFVRNYLWDLITAGVNPVWDTLP